MVRLSDSFGWRRHAKLAWAFLSLSVLLSLARPAIAQETRAEEQRREQAAKSAALTPSTKNSAERIVDRLRQFGFFEDEPRGFYPFVGKIYPSGGMAFGAGYRHAFRDTGALTARTALSVENFKSAGLNLELPRVSRGRVAVEAALQWIDAPTVPFYGVGPDSRESDNTTFGYRPASVGVALRYQPWRTLTLGGGVEYLHIAATAGWTTADRPLWPEPRAELTDDQRYVHARGFAVFDWRTDEGFTGRGGLYRVDVDDYAAAGDAPTSFRRVEGEALQLVPILRGNWVIAVRGLTTLTYMSGDNALPFYLLPTLGGSDLRGFSTMRFRGRQRALGSAELRWTPARVLDMAIFYDAGRVGERPGDLTRGTFEQSYGVGARLHGQGGSAMRVDLAHSREHAVRVALSFGVAF